MLDAIGVVALIVGSRTGRALVRQSGLGLLGLATAKVFAIDLASMDVAYRALVLAGLGALLLLSAWLFTRYRAATARRAGPAGRHAAGRLSPDRRRVRRGTAAACIIPPRCDAPARS